MVSTIYESDGTFGESSNKADGIIDFRSETLYEYRFNSVPTTIELYRFRNTTKETGTYLFVGEKERDAILGNPNLNRIFELEGIDEDGSINPAFKASSEPDDDLIVMNRFHNSHVPGTYLYAGQAESINIRQNFPNFIEEGVAFYVYGADANRGLDFYRFQNTELPGTYIFVGEAERQNILANFPQFEEEGVAFEALI